MYPDDGAEAGAATPIGNAVRKFNLEGLIPLVLLVIIGIASLNYFGVVDIPYLPKGNQHLQVLFIGEPSLGERVVLDNLSYMLTVRTMDAASFGNSVSEELSQYDLVMLDQTQTANRSISVALGEALRTYVQKGGKIVLVMNSGAYQSVGFQGMTATDAVNWKATMGDVSPMECGLDRTGVPSCAMGKETTVVGRIQRSGLTSPIMQGVEVAPPVNEPPYSLTTLEDVTKDAGAREIAYIKSENTPKAVSAIVEKKHFPFGTVVYFNYDPGLTPRIFTNTIMYLR